MHFARFLAVLSAAIPALGAPISDPALCPADNPVLSTLNAYSDEAGPFCAAFLSTKSTSSSTKTAAKKGGVEQPPPSSVVEMVRRGDGLLSYRLTVYPSSAVSTACSCFGATASPVASMPTSVPVQNGAPATATTIVVPVKNGAASTATTIVVPGAPAAPSVAPAAPSVAASVPSKVPAAPAEPVPRRFKIKVNGLYFVFDTQYRHYMRADWAKLIATDFAIDAKGRLIIIKPDNYYTFGYSLNSENIQVAEPVWHLLDNYNTKTEGDLVASVNEQNQVVLSSPQTGCEVPMKYLYFFGAPTTAGPQIDYEFMRTYPDTCEPATTSKTYLTVEWI